MSDDFFGFISFKFLKVVKEVDDFLVDGFFLLFVVKLNVFKVNEFLSDDLDLFFVFSEKMNKREFVIVKILVVNEDDFFFVNSVKDESKNKNVEFLVGKDMILSLFIVFFFGDDIFFIIGDKILEKKFKLSLEKMFSKVVEFKIFLLFDNDDLFFVV